MRFQIIGIVFILDEIIQIEEVILFMIIIKEINTNFYEALVSKNKILITHATHVISATVCRNTLCHYL